MRRLGEHAVVIGGSMGGLLAARVLSDHYDRVTVVERDELGVAHPFEALDAHEQRLPLRPFDFLREPLEGLRALVTLRQYVDAPLGGHGAQRAQAAPHGDPRARPPGGRQGVGEDDPGHARIDECNIRRYSVQ